MELKILTGAHFEVRGAEYVGSTCRWDWPRIYVTFKMGGTGNGSCLRGQSASQAWFKAVSRSSIGVLADIIWTPGSLNHDFSPLWGSCKSGLVNMTRSIWLHLYAVGPLLALTRKRLPSTSSQTIIPFSAKFHSNFVRKSFLDCHQM